MSWATVKQSQHGDMVRLIEGCQQRRPDPHHWSEAAFSLKSFFHHHPCTSASHFSDRCEELGCSLSVHGGEERVWYSVYLFRASNGGYRDAQNSGNIPGSLLDTGSQTLRRLATVRRAYECTALVTQIELTSRGVILRRK